jgi:hypothetical protein
MFKPGKFKLTLVVKGMNQSRIAFQLFAWTDTSFDELK